MHHDDIPIAARSAAEVDRMTEMAVLMSVLDVHPAQLTVGELTREMTLDSQRFSDRDGVSRAIERLVGVGLLRLHGDAVLITRAAQYIKALGIL